MLLFRHTTNTLPSASLLKRQLEREGERVADSEVRSARQLLLWSLWQIRPLVLFSLFLTVSRILFPGIKSQEKARERKKEASHAP